MFDEIKSDKTTNHRTSKAAGKAQASLPQLLVIMAWF
jgi:hypothetical protein